MKKARKTAAKNRVTRKVGATPIRTRGGPASKGTSLSPGTILRHSRDVISRANPDGTVMILSLEDADNFHLIDGLAAEVWKALNGRTPLVDIERKILEEHAPPAARFRKDMSQFLRSLLKKGLIEAKGR